MGKFMLAAISLLVFGSSTLDRSSGPYITLDPDGDALREAFNAGHGKIRVIAYLAPTCGGCLRGASILDSDVLAEIDSEMVDVLVVWVPKNGGREEHVDRVTRLVSDERATHYWDEHGAAVEAFDRQLGLEGRACAGAFLLYDADARWEGDTPPAPDYWSDAHASEFKQHGPAFDAPVLLQELRDMISQ